MNGSLSSWPVAPGISWIQAADPRFARKLAKRNDSRLVAVGVAGGFLRIFEMRRSPAFMRSLVARYKAANERFSKQENAQEGTESSGRVKGRHTRQLPHKSENPHDGKSADSQKFTRNLTGSEVTNEP